MPPRILLMPDKRGWAFDFHCSYQVEALRERGWQVDVVYLRDNRLPPRPIKDYDLAFNPNYSPRFIDRYLHGKLVRGIYGHKWAWSANPRHMLDRMLRGAVAVVVPNRKLNTMIGWYFPRTHQISEGTDPKIFKLIRQRTGRKLIVGWTGDPRHTWKRLNEIVVPACLKAHVELRVATDLIREKLCEFYNDVDVVLVASIEEGSPNAVFEAGACGRTIIGTEVGIIPEIIVNRKNGFIVEGNIDAFSEKLTWCQENVDEVRAMGLALRETILSDYTVEQEANNFSDLMEELLFDLSVERRFEVKTRKLVNIFLRKIQSGARRLRVLGRIRSS